MKLEGCGLKPALKEYYGFSRAFFERTKPDPNLRFAEGPNDQGY